MVAARGYRTDLQGVAIQLPNEPGYNREDRYVIDDWRYYCALRLWRRRSRTFNRQTCGAGARRDGGAAGDAG